MTSDRKKGPDVDVSAAMAPRDADDTLRSAHEWAMFQSVERVRQTVLAAAREAGGENKGPRGDYPGPAEIPSSLLNPLESLPPFLKLDEVKESTRDRAVHRSTETE